MLNYEALWELSKRQAEHDAALTFSPEEIERRKKEADRLTWHYYLQRITPPSK